RQERASESSVSMHNRAVGEMVPLPGVEPGTSGSTIRRSNQLSYNGTYAGATENENPSSALLLRSAKRPYEQSQSNSRLLARQSEDGHRRPLRARRRSRKKGRREEPAFPVSASGRRAGLLPGGRREEEPPGRETLTP